MSAWPHVDERFIEGAAARLHHPCRLPAQVLGAPAGQCCQVLRVHACSRYKELYKCKYDPETPEFGKKIEFPSKANEIYVCIGVKASNYFMPKEVLIDKGLGVDALMPLSTRAGEYTS